MDYKKQIFEYLKDCSDEKNKEINFLYFDGLYQKYKNPTNNVEIILANGINDSNIIPYAIADEKLKQTLHVQSYETLLGPSSSQLKEINLCICKMQAGLGTSVEREDLVAKYTNRKNLGAKGTDLFINYHGKMISIAENQLLLAIEKSLIYKRVSFQNLINEETKEAVSDIWENYHPELKKKYLEIFNSDKLIRYPDFMQLMMPTINGHDELTFKRTSPCGHGFLGFAKILEIFRKEKINADSDIFVIGNGEDLKSTPDEKIISWVFENEIPITMITTTKLEKDKKGGQLAIVRGEKPYVSIIEKAQAEKANQLEYFEELGLREGDGESLFNTNIVIINEVALKKIFNKYLDISESEFLELLTPDVIKNKKEQNGHIYTQLEGAIGSVLLNLDKFFRIQYNYSLVSFLNLSAESREKFFVPIKTREDFDEIYGH